MKTIFATSIALASLFSVCAFGGSNKKITLVNHGNAAAECALAKFDALGGTIDVYSWFEIADGGTRTFDDVNWVHCEVKGNPGRVWFSSALGDQLCVTRGAQHVNPLYAASNPAACSLAGGTMVHFWNSPGNGPIQEVLNP
jgi:hypothetical protein